MAEFRWIVMSSFLMLQVLSFRAAPLYPSFTVRDGDEVTLPCGNVKHDQDKCDFTKWFFIDSGEAVLLFEDGKIHEAAATKSDRLSVSENYSLVIKNVTDEDASQYVCMFRSGQQEDATLVVFLSVVTMTEQKNNDEVTLNCSVSHGWCVHTAKWLYEGHQYDEETSQDTCSAWLRIKTSHLDQKTKSLMKCEVTDWYTGGVQQFTFSPPQSSGDAATKTTNNETSENNTNKKKPEGRWRLIVVHVGLAALIIVTVYIWTRTKGNKPRTEENERSDEDEDEGTVNYEHVGDLLPPSHWTDE